MFYTPKEGVAFASSPELVATMEKVASFSFDKALLGADAKSAEAIGMEFPGGKTWGDAKNIKLRFDAEYMQLAADGKL
jgi:NitT/TauT family transport system substrate-binding protein